LFLELRKRQYRINVIHYLNNVVASAVLRRIEVYYNTRAYRLALTLNTNNIFCNLHWYYYRLTTIRRTRIVVVVITLVRRAKYHRHRYVLYFIWVLRFLCDYIILWFIHSITRRLTSFASYNNRYTLHEHIIIDNIMYMCSATNPGINLTYALL